jgi:membrane dipeptidase
MSAIPVLDAHYDGLILREVRGDALDLVPAAPLYHADLPRLRRGGYALLMTMVGDHDLRQSSRLINAVHALCAAHPRRLALCLTRADVEAVVRRRAFGLIMTIEGQAMFAEETEHLRNWIRLGVRLASLTHGEGRFMGNPAALQYDGSHFGYVTPAERDLLRRQTKGLAPFAFRALDVMAEHGIPCDLAHANEAAYWQALEHARGPVCYTHGACYALCPHSRCLTDEMMKALAARGGVMAIAFYPAFISQRDPGLDDLVEHFLHALDVMGPEHVGLGTDYDGMSPTVSPVLPCEETPRLWEALARKGVTRAVIEKIAWRNFARLMPG